MDRSFSRQAIPALLSILVAASVVERLERAVTALVLVPAATATESGATPSPAGDAAPRTIPRARRATVRPR